MSNKQVGERTESEGSQLWLKTQTQNLLRNQTSGIYYGRWTIGGKQIWKSLKTKVYSVAKLRLADESAKVARQRGASQAVSSQRAPADSFAWQRELDEADNDFANDDEAEVIRDEALETASRHSHSLSAEERKLLGQLRDYASHAANIADSKAKALITWLKANIKPDDRWSDRRVIIFTEYRTTQKWLHGLLAAEGLAGEHRLLTIFGGMPLKDAAGQYNDRESIKAAFQASPTDSPVRILLSTDAASEGVNLQNHCWQLFHYEIPWNPNRMEQRNGRVDRHGQKNPEVHVHHFVGRGFDAKRSSTETTPGDLEGDLEFLFRAALKVETIREDLGKVRVPLILLFKAAVLSPSLITTLQEARQRLPRETWKSLLTHASVATGPLDEKSIVTGLNRISNRDIQWAVHQGFKASARATWAEVAAALLAIEQLASSSAPAIHIVWTGPASGSFAARRVDQFLYDLLAAAKRRVLLVTFG